MCVVCGLVGWVNSDWRANLHRLPLALYPRKGQMLDLKLDYNDTIRAFGFNFQVWLLVIQSISNYLDDRQGC